MQKAIEKDYELHFNYTEMNEIMQIIKQHNCTIHKNEMQLFCIIQIGIPMRQLNEVLGLLVQVKNMELTPMEAK